MKTKLQKSSTQTLRVGIVVPHIFMQRDILPRVIFSPGKLALDLVAELKAHCDITLYTPAPVDTSVPNITADTSYFETELAGRGDSYLDLLKKHPFTFVTLARQLQSELIARAYADANAGKLDVLHIYCNEEDTALPFAQFCRVPVVFTHHDPFNFLVKYKNVFPKYKHLNWVSFSDAQRASMPAGTNWLATIYHGLPINELQFQAEANNNYVVYMGRIIQPKGVHLAIAAVKKYNKAAKKPIKLKIAGKHYAEHKKDSYWKQYIEPELEQGTIEYVGYIKTIKDKQTLLGGAAALLAPSLFAEPFGMMSIEALACGTPVIGVGNGAISEVIHNGTTGFVVPNYYEQTSKTHNEPKIINDLSAALTRIDSINRADCRADFEKRFTLTRMCQEYLSAYRLVSRG